MTKTLIAGGDSFTFGSELPDCNNLKHSNLTWSALLSKKLNLDYKCVAKQGAGNAAIMRLVVDEIEKNNNVEFVAVMWSWPGRIEIKVDELNEKFLKSVLPENDVEDRWINISPWNSISFEERLEKMADLQNDSYFLEKYKKQFNLEKELGLDTLSRSYFSLASDDHHLYQSAISIFTLQCYLEKKNIDYIFAATSDHILEIFKKKDIPFVNMLDKSKWLNLDTGMYQWALDNNYNVSAMNHPEAKAHEDWLNVYYKN